MGASTYKLFAVSPPGLEQATAMELSDLGIEGKPEPGGINFTGDLRELYLANLWLRTASRILLRVGHFRLTHLNEISDRFSRYPWELYIPEKASLRLRITTHKSRLYHTGAIEERAISGIEKRIGRLAPENRSLDPALVIVRIVRDKCVVSVDSSGDHLYKRGYKIDTLRAPLRENLAAGVILLSGWLPDRPLIDPFCGSGTIAIEAAMLARRMAPGIRRSFAFEKWRNFDKMMWEELKTNAMKQSRCCQTKVAIYASDHDEKAVRVAQKNAEQAGVSEFIEFRVSPLSALVSKDQQKGWIVTNPPYGKRIKQRKSLTGLYRALGKILRERFSGWNLALLCADKSFKKELSLPVETIGRFSNGGIEVEILFLPNLNLPSSTRHNPS